MTCWWNAKHNVCEDIAILSAEFNFFVCIQISNKHKHKTMLKQMAARFINHAIIPIRRTVQQYIVMTINFVFDPYRLRYSALLKIYNSVICEITPYSPNYSGLPYTEIKNWRQTWDLRSEVSGLRSQVSGSKSQISDLRSQTSDLRSQISDLRSQTSDLRLQTSDLRPQTSDLRPQTTIYVYPF